MSAHITARDALLRDLENAEAERELANQDYAKAERELHRAQAVAESRWDNRAAKSRSVDQIKRAIAILEGEDDV